MIPMHSITKIVVALLVAALIAVIALMIWMDDQSAGEPAAGAATQIAATAQPEATAGAEETGNEHDIEETDPQNSQAEAESAGTDEAANEAQDDEAQGTMYEGALAGLSEEEIAKLAMAEEEAMHAEGGMNEGAEGAVD